MNITTQPPHTINGDVAVSYVLVPFFLITAIGIVAAVVLYIRRKRRFPNEWLRFLTVVQGWMRTYQQRRPLLSKDPDA
ncbi:putative protein C3orf18-like protein [Labeo rohita]|uniref:Uncharacterized protein n=1 Tax=Labeo rohita TaxID=84645 RepID=A0A498NP33_LABRO|nr:putative protein C3orf18-like protein [Labeo rohita]